METHVELIGKVVEDSSENSLRTYGEFVGNRTKNWRTLENSWRTHREVHGELIRKLVDNSRGSDEKPLGELGIRNSLRTRTENRGEFMNKLWKMHGELIRKLVNNSCIWRAA